ncbi:hypothetical protein P170DRAFT_359785 [Aspergillus steynii IBT 23096]|uniref:DNA repair protein Dds20/Sfr1 n=1 Tax=Aspergillus steynii IBT 23096 TaxID=1392250 RepID=A0A2I2G5Y5_9EURO|nr:uncharacterized protein P170DRAFT_359785 [Aspergillus steynii IBT 23096]PLB48287.1 hypothetical protein P170DRAFT_359785 [Aspergillus steynii IBT 23096]
MGPGTLNEKRRRAQHATSALSKPFKSPLRRPLQTSEIKEETSPTIKERISSPDPTHQASAAHPAGEAKTEPEPTTSTTLSSSAPSINSPSSSASSPLSSRNRKRKNPTSRLTPSKKPVLLDPETTALQKQQRALQSRLSALRSELDTARQALRVESSGKDTELEKLIGKWKGVSRNAAEEVFAGAQERVTRLGGMKAWREQMRNNNSRWEQEEMDSWYGGAEGDGVDVDEEELEARKAEMLEQWDVPGKEAEDKKREEATEEEEFTMDFMLKTLNVDLKLIGYDKEGQRWVRD